MNKDGLSICPKCQGDACYKTPINETAFNYFCFGCGYQTNDLLKVEDLNFEEYEATMPELHKDAKFIDTKNRVWYPITINLPTKGTVFLGGKSLEYAEWTAIKVRSLSEEEQKELANKGLTYKSDSSTIKGFGEDFIEALDYINFFDN